MEAAAAAAVTPAGGGGGGGGEEEEHTFLHQVIDVILNLSQNQALEMSDVSVVSKSPFVCVCIRVRVRVDMGLIENLSAVIIHVRLLIHGVFFCVFLKVFYFVLWLFRADYCEDNLLDGLEVISNVAKLHSGVTQVARCALNYLAGKARCFIVVFYCGVLMWCFIVVF